MKKLAIFAAAFVLALGLAQCKKEQPATPQNTEGNIVHLTVNVGDGSRASIDPSSSGEYNFNDGDLLYVGYDNACCGALTYSSSTQKFTGSLTIDQNGEQLLHFYYLGGDLVPTITDNDKKYTVDISDQSTNYPVISYGTSTTNYSASKNSYTTVLLVKCGLVKFNLSPGTTESVSVGGLYTKATIDFNNPGVVTPSTEGTITLHSGANNDERWAILLPQSSVSATATISGYDCSIASFSVADNDYNTTGVNIAIPFVDLSSYSGDTYSVTEDVIIKGTPSSSSFTINYAGDGFEVTLDNVNPEGSKDVLINGSGKNVNVKLKGTSRLSRIVTKSKASVSIDEAEAGGTVILINESNPLGGVAIANSVSVVINGGIVKAKCTGTLPAVNAFGITVNGGAVYFAGGGWEACIGGITSSVTLYGWNEENEEWGTTNIYKQYVSTDNSSGNPTDPENTNWNW